MSACLKVIALAALLPLGSAVHAEAVAKPGELDPRIRCVAYEADQVYRLQAVVGYQIDLQFEAGESFVGIAAGDLDGISYVAKEQHVFLKPRAAAVATNLTVLTDRRTYQFEYVAQPRRLDAERAAPIYALRFVYGALSPPTVNPETPAVTVEQQLSNASAVATRNDNYRYSGARSLRPDAMWDDGTQMHLHFGAGRDLPALFVREDDGTESLANISIEADEVIVHRLAARLIVRRGKLVGHIVNRVFGGGRRALPTGTVSPEVTRRTREVLP